MTELGDSPLLTLTFWLAVLAGGLRLAVPLGLAALGELIGERAGVLNLGVEGTMALGAVAGIMVAAVAGTTAGLLGGALVGGLVGFAFGWAVLRLRMNEIVAGFALALGGVGLAVFLYRSLYQRAPLVIPYPPLVVPGLSDLPLLGDLLFRQTPMIWLLPIGVLITAWAIARTRAGLELRAAGEGPEAARARGVDVERVRLGALIVAGALGGLGGSVLSTGIVGEFSDQIIGGRGFVALALVIAAQWRPGVLLLAAYAIGSLQSLQLRVQANVGAGLPVELLAALPFLVTLATLAFGVGSGRAPRALGRVSEETA